MLEMIYRNIYRFRSDDRRFYPASFCYYIKDSRNVLIDTSLDPDFIADIAPSSVDLILNTHFHRDHTGSNHCFPEAETFCHPLDREPIESLEAYLHRYGLTNRPHLQPHLLKIAPWQPSPSPATFLAGQHICLDQVELEVLHTPGHTRGHCCFYWQSKGILFSGDIDLIGGGPWYGHPDSDMDDLINSINVLIELEPKIILSGHHSPVKQKGVYYLNKYLNILIDREQHILRHLKQPITLEDLCYRHLIYKQWPAPSELWAFFEGHSLLVHLRRLIGLGLVKEKAGRYHAV